MYASIRRYKTNSAPEVTRQVKEGFLPVISKAPGFVAYYAIESGQDEWASISIFSSQAEAEKSNQLAAEWVKKTTVAALTGPPQITAGNVVIQKTK